MLGRCLSRVNPHRDCWRSESSNENKNAEGKKTGALCKSIIFRFCLPVRINSNYPHLTFFLFFFFRIKSIFYIPHSRNHSSWYCWVLLIPHQSLPNIWIHGWQWYPQLTLQPGVIYHPAVLYALHRHILLHAHMPFSAQFSLSQSGFHTCSPSWASSCLCPRPGRSPVRLLSCNWELLSSWGFHFWPYGHTVAVPVSHLTTLHADLDPLSCLPSSACDLPRR